jgi:sortase A
VKVGDAIEMHTPRGDLRYEVADIRIVLPTDVSVLDPTERDSLTLITCYPFYYVGHAPKRFIVRAERTALPSPAQP